MKGMRVNSAYRTQLVTLMRKYRVTGMNLLWRLPLERDRAAVRYLVVVRRDVFPEVW